LTSRLCARNASIGLKRCAIKLAPGLPGFAPRLVQPKVHTRASSASIHSKRLKCFKFTRQTSYENWVRWRLTPTSGFCKSSGSYAAGPVWSTRHWLRGSEPTNRGVAPSPPRSWEISAGSNTTEVLSGAGGSGSRQSQERKSCIRAYLNGAGLGPWGATGLRLGSTIPKRMGAGRIPEARGGLMWVSRIGVPAKLMRSGGTAFKKGAAAREVAGALLPGCVSL